jgi:ABC-type microcin C transport system permease subunit YejB
MTGIGHNQQQRSVQGLTEEDRKILRRAVLEMNDSMTRVGAERELQKETISEVSNKLGIDKKLLRRMAKSYFLANYKDVVQENSDFEEFYSAVMEKTSS